MLAGCVFRSLRGSSGAAWSLQTKRGRNEEKPTAASFVKCVFENNQALVKGGAFHLEPQAGLLLSDCVFGNNTAPKGQDIAAEEPEPSVYASPQISIFSSSAGKRGFQGKAQGSVVTSQPLSQAPVGKFLQGNDQTVLDIKQVRASTFLRQPALQSLTPTHLSVLRLFHEAWPFPSGTACSRGSIFNYRNMYRRLLRAIHPSPYQICRSCGNWQMKLWCHHLQTHLGPLKTPPCQQQQRPQATALQPHCRHPLLKHSRRLEQQKHRVKHYSHCRRQPPSKRVVLACAELWSLFCAAW